MIGSRISGETYRARILRDVPVGYWRLTDASGLVAVDTSASPHHGAISATGVTYGTAGPLSDGSQALTFDGVSGFVGITGLTNRPTPTFEAWVTMTPAGRASGFQILSAQNAGSHLKMFLGGVVVFGLEVTGVNQALVSPTPLAADSWQHLVGTYDGTTMALYLNGQLNISAVHAGAASTGATLRIGQYVGGGSFANGSIAEAAMYPAALTSQQVAEHYGLQTDVPSGVRVGGTGAPVGRHVFLPTPARTSLGRADTVRSIGAAA
jgi:hypothetical protein